MKIKAMPEPKHIFLLSSSDTYDDAGQHAKALFTALAEIPNSAWSQPEKMCLGHKLTASYGNNERIAVVLHNAKNDGILTSQIHSISIGPDEPNKMRFLLNLKSASLHLDRDAIDPQSIKDACCKFIVLDHDDLDNFTIIDPRTGQASPLDRIAPNIISVLSIQIPEEKRNFLTIGIAAWYQSPSEEWILDIESSSGSAESFIIPKDNLQSQEIAQFMVLDNSSRSKIFFDDALSQADMLTAIVEHKRAHYSDEQWRNQLNIEPISNLLAKMPIDPIHAMQSIAVLSDLRTRFTPKPLAEDEWDQR